MENIIEKIRNTYHDEELKEYLLKNIDTLNEKEINMLINIFNLINKIGYISLKYIGLDEFTNIRTINDDLVHNEELQGSNIFNLSIPYNDISFNKETSKYLMNITQIYYRIVNNIIPSISYFVKNKNSFCYHNLNKIYKIKRSTGKIQNARVRYNAGIFIYKLQDSNYKDIYIRMEYSNDEETDLNCMRDIHLPLYKDIPLNKLIELNPDIKVLVITYKLPNINKFKENTIEYNLSKFIMEMHNIWLEKEMRPLFKKRLESLNIPVEYKNVN